MFIIVNFSKMLFSELPLAKNKTVIAAAKMKKRQTYMDIMDKFLDPTVLATSLSYEEGTSYLV